MADKKKRDYALEYERRRIRAQAQGFKSPGEKTRYNRAKNESAQQGKKLTVANYRRKIEATQKATQKRRTQTRLTFQGAPTNLRKWGISENKLNKIRTENRRFDKEKAWGRLAYNYQIDQDLKNFTDERIGYILGYNQVFVHPKTKQLTGKARMRQVAAYEKLINKYELLADEADLLGYRYARELAA